MIFRHFILFLLIMITFSQCQYEQPIQTEDALEKNLLRAGSNRAALEKVLHHYQERPEDSLKLQAAILLISNMERNYYYKSEWHDQYDVIFHQTASLSEPLIQSLKDSLYQILGSPDQAALQLQNDLRILSAEYLIQNIDQAFTAWQRAPWKTKIDFNIFSNYILPYRIFNEKPEEWRDLLYNRYKNLLNNDTSAEVITCVLNEDLKSWFRYSDQFNDLPERISISHLLEGQRGNCSDMASLAAHCARALGIPVAIDYTPQWGNYHDGHVWNALIINEKESASFLGAEANPGEYTGLPEGESKIAKAFRRTLTVQENSVAVQAAKAGEVEVPIYLQNPRIQDVTHLYTETYDIKLKINKPTYNFVYLCIAKQNQWEAITGSAIDAQGFAHFNNMGHNILYHPMFYENGKYQSAGAPFILTYEGDLQFLTNDENNTQNVRLTRIFPFKRADAKWKYAEYFRDARVEGAHKQDFSDAKTLHIITHPLDEWHIGQMGGPVVRDRLEHESLWKEVNIVNKNAFRYIRLIFPDNQFCKVGELQFKDKNNIILAGKAIGSVQHPEWAFDGVPGYSIIDESPEGGHWVGLDLGADKIVQKFRYLPATGVYDIQPGKTYELFYWKDEWKSLGIIKSDKHYIDVNKVPTNALFWLHCKDCNNAFERPFTYENGKQIWW